MLLKVQSPWFGAPFWNFATYVQNELVSTDTIIASTSLHPTPVHLHSFLSGFLARGYWAQAKLLENPDSLVSPTGGGGHRNRTPNPSVPSLRSNKRSQHASHWHGDLTSSQILPSLCALNLKGLWPAQGTALTLELPLHLFLRLILFCVPQVFPIEAWLGTLFLKCKLTESRKMGAWFRLASAPWLN